MTTTERTEYAVKYNDGAIFPEATEQDAKDTLDYANEQAEYHPEFAGARIITRTIIVTEGDWTE